MFVLDRIADRLDLTGPFEVLACLPNADVHLIWKDLQPVVSDVGLKILPSKTFADCPKLDVICIPRRPAGAPDTAPPAVVSEFCSYVEGMRKRRGEVVARAAQKLPLSAPSQSAA